MSRSPKLLADRVALVTGSTQGLGVGIAARMARVNPVEFQAELNNCAVAPRFALAALDHGTFARLLG